MNKETIDKASRDYVMPNANIRPLMESIAAKEGFISGANWHIKSVWHDMKKEIPQPLGMYAEQHYPQIPCLVYGISEGCGYGIRFWNVTEKCWDDEECDDYYCDKEKIEKWAYLDDLIPEGKEAQP